MLRYLHGKDIFEILCDRTTGLVTFDKFRMVGFMLGIPSTIILSTHSILAPFYDTDMLIPMLHCFQPSDRLAEYNINSFSSFDLESFTLYYFDILCFVDNYSSATSNSGEKTKKSKTGWKFGSFKRRKRDKLK